MIIHQLEKVKLCRIEAWKIEATVKLKNGSSKTHKRVRNSAGMKPQEMLVWNEN